MWHTLKPSDARSIVDGSNRKLHEERKTLAPTGRVQGPVLHEVSLRHLLSTELRKTLRLLVVTLLSLPFLLSRYHYTIHLPIAILPPARDTTSRIAAHVLIWANE